MNGGVVRVKRVYLLDGIAAAGMLYGQLYLAHAVFKKLKPRGSKFAVELIEHKRAVAPCIIR